MNKHIVIGLMAVLIACLLTTTAWAQATAQISGTVKDQSAGSRAAGFPDFRTKRDCVAGERKSRRESHSGSGAGQRTG